MNQRAIRAREKRKKTFQSTTKPSSPRNRLIVLLALFLIVGVACIAVLIDLQAVRSDDLRADGETQRTGKRPIAGYRGSIVDRNGFAMASSTPNHQIVTDPSLLLDPVATAGLLAPILEMEPTELQGLIMGDGPEDKYSLIVRGISEEVLSRIEVLNESPNTKHLMQGVYIKAEEGRAYPAEDLAVSIVGRVDLDENGIFGIEQQYNDVMTGVVGLEEFERGRFGSISVGNSKIKPAREGFDVVTTLDHRLQFKAEQTLLKHCEDLKAQGATAVVSEPVSGEILALASVERNDEGVCEVPKYVKALIDTFEPGSVLKPITAAAAVEELEMRADSTITVPSSVTVGGKKFTDHPPHEPAAFPITQIMADSMNVGIIKLAQQLGDESVYAYLKDFGLGEMSDLGIKGESRGLIRETEEWWGSDSGSIPIGQGVTVNALQLNAAYNVFANAGVFQKPVLVRSLRSPEGQDLVSEPAQRLQVISPDTVDEVNKMLRSVVEDGTGKNAAIEGYSVAGKTGTAWKVFDDGSGKMTYGSDGNRRYVTTFAGFAPVDSPVISMVVMVDEPKTETTASMAAAPVFSEIGTYALQLYSVTSVETAEVAENEKVKATPAGYQEPEPLAPVVVADAASSDLGVAQPEIIDEVVAVAP